MTQLKRLITPTALLALTFAAAPAFAQERYHGRENKSGQASGEKAQPRSESRPQGGAAPRVETRQEAPRAQQPAPQAQQPAPQAQQPAAAGAASSGRAAAGREPLEQRPPVSGARERGSAERREPR